MKRVNNPKHPNRMHMVKMNFIMLDAAIALLLLDLRSHHTTYGVQVAWG